MSQGGGFSLSRLAVLFGVVAGVAIGTNMVLDRRSKRDIGKLPAPKQTDARPTAQILEFKPRR